jgi:hypothetical protein
MLRECMHIDVEASAANWHHVDKPDSRPKPASKVSAGAILWGGTSLSNSSDLVLQQDFNRAVWEGSQIQLNEGSAMPLPRPLTSVLPNRKGFCNFTCIQRQPEQSLLFKLPLTTQIAIKGYGLNL